jgi:hypothetical protein
MVGTYRRLIAAQFEAGLCTLGHCIAWCPEALWPARVVRYRFCQVAFHVLFFADYYLEQDPDSFDSQPFHLATPTLFGALRDDEEPLDAHGDPVYPRAEVQAYLDYCRRKALDTLAAETEQTLSAPAKHPRRNFSRAELHIYNIRHIQHHAAQLIVRLRLDSDVDVPWIGSGWRDPGARASTP